MPSCNRAILTAAVLAATPLIGSTAEIDSQFTWGHICSYSDIQSGRVAAGFWTAAHARAATVPTTTCAPPPSMYQTLPSVGNDADTTVNLAIGYTFPPSQLCFVATGLNVAPVLRVGVGHTLSVDLQNTLSDTSQPGGVANANCPIDSFGGEGVCEPKPVFAEAPGADGMYYPIMANVAHTADGTSNLHVHGLFVPPTPCSDEVLKSALYPTNWLGPIGPLLKCQSASNELAYTYKLPADHPAGLYWYHTHRHGQAEHQTQMGLIGAIVVEDKGDVWRKKIGVTDEVLLIGDTPATGCLVGPGCDVVPHHGTAPRQPNQDAARQAARTNVAQMVAANVVLNPRIDQADQAGECAQGASGPAGGTELWTLTLNGAQVPEALNGFPRDSELLQKSMHPGERQIFRLANASANSWVAPELVLSQNGVETAQPLEVFARDGVGITDARGNRIFRTVDVSQTQLVIPPAGRIEFVVHAPPAGARLYLQSSQVFPGCGGNLYTARRLLLITPQGAAVDPGAPDDSDLLEHTPSLAPYLATLGTEASVNRIFVLSEYSRGFTYPLTHWLQQTPSAADYDPSQTDFYITEVQASDGSVKQGKVALTPFPGIHSLAAQVVVHLHGQQSVTEDWLIENATLEIHAFHIHQIHFRDIASNSPFPDQGALLDTVTIPAAPLIGTVATGYPGAPGWVRLRMTFTAADIGEFVFHCHILEHEDNGMMAKVQVVAD